MDDFMDQLMEDLIYGGYGDVLQQLEDDAEFENEYPDIDEPGDWAFEQQEREDFEQCDEYFEYFGGEEW